MISYRSGSGPGPGPVLSSLLAPLLVLLLIGLSCSSCSSSYVSAHPQVADEPRQLMLEVRNLEFMFFPLDFDEDEYFLLIDLGVKDFSGNLLFRQQNVHSPAILKILQEDSENVCLILTRTNLCSFLLKLVFDQLQWRVTV